MTSMLNDLTLPDDLSSLSMHDLEGLAEEIRASIINRVSQNGGHLASNLGVVELTCAMLSVFNPRNNPVVWDTSHQAYAYKLLTGRHDLFNSLRETDGCCGFLNRDESEMDHFGAGHAGTAISAAAGFAAARDRKPDKGQKVIAVVGDGALGCGASLEGLNNLSEATDDFILVLNDNKMSISPNVGALSKYLNHIISGEAYNHLKDIGSHAIESLPFLGTNMNRQLRKVESAIKGLFVPGTIFEELGMRYIGPLDGHDIGTLKDTFQRLSHLKQRMVVHVITEKGHGFQPAVSNPTKFHSTGTFCPEEIAEPTSSESPDAPETHPAPPPPKSSKSFSEAFGDAVCSRLDKDKDTIAIVAGMCGGTGLDKAAESYPEQFVDVGIAEEHAVVFAAGLAAAGKRPLVAIYATFMQRAVDYVLHDICLQKLPVVFCLDRAGYVPDGPTHHGIHDLAYWRSCPGLSVLQPADDTELANMLETSFQRGVPAVIRYPKADCTDLSANAHGDLAWGKAHTVREGIDASLWCLGREVETGLKVADLLKDHGIDLNVENTRFISPFDVAKLKQQAAEMPIVTLEDHCVPNGLSSVVDEILIQTSHQGVHHFGWPNEIIPWGSSDDQRQRYGLDAQTLSDQIHSILT